MAIGGANQQSLFDLFDKRISPLSRSVSDAVAMMSDDHNESGRGAFYTRPQVAEFILDLIGYTDDLPLHQMRILEPSFGDGVFLIPIVKRLISAWNRFGNGASSVVSLTNSIRAVELHHDTFNKTRAKLLGFLHDHGIDPESASMLASAWLVHGDFLLEPFSVEFTHVVGNPPYIRQESIPDALVSEYRRRYRTMFDRADIYVPFVERGLQLLAAGGSLGFICSDRWLKNRYGIYLRKIISRDFRLRYFVNMVGTDAFVRDVAAYTGIFVVSRTEPGGTLVATPKNVDQTTLNALRDSLACISTSGDSDGATTIEVHAVSVVSAGSQPGC